MNKQQSKHREMKHSRLQGLLLSSAIIAFLAIVMGGIARVTGSDGTCLNWPSCYGSVTFPSDQKAILDYTHRILIFVTFPLLSGSFISAWKQTRKQKLILFPLTLALGFSIMQIALDAWLVRAHDLLSQTAISAIQSGASLSHCLGGVYTRCAGLFGHGMNHPVGHPIELRATRIGQKNSFV